MPEMARNNLEGQVSTPLGKVTVVPKGPYDPETQYTRLDLVQHEGSSYVAKRDVIGVTPTEGEDWMLVAAKGDMGVGDMSAEDYDPHGKKSDVYAYAEKAAAEATAPVKEDTEKILADTAQLKTDATQIKEDVDGVKTDVGSVKTDVADVKSDVGTVKTDVAGVKEDVAGVKEDVGTVKTDVAGVKEDVGAVKTDVAGVKTDVAGVKTDVAGVKESAEKILLTLTGQRPKRYGYRIKKSEANSFDRVEYIYDAESMTPAKMDFSGGSFNYGSWQDIWLVRDNYPCMLNLDGTEAYRLDPNDYTKKLGETAADSAVSDLTSTMNAMAAFPLVWVKRWEEGDYEYTVFCEDQYDDSYKAYAHTRTDGKIARVTYAPCFKGCLDTEGRLRSIAGQYPQYSIAAQAEIDAAKKNGALWNIRSWALNELIADLCTLISKNDHSQNAFGQGQTSGYVNNAEQHYGHLQTGTLMKMGQFFGYNTTTQQVKVFHVESFWGGRWDRLVGLIQRGGVYLAKMTPEGGGYNLTGVGYTPISKSLEGLAASGSGWQHNTCNSPLGRVPIGPFDGNDSTNDGDFFWWNQGITAVALAGGACDSGSPCGARSLLCNAAASGAHWIFGASPSCEGPSI